MNKSQWVGLKVPLPKALRELAIEAAAGAGTSFDDFVARGYRRLRAEHAFAAANNEKFYESCITPGVKRGVQGHYVRILFPTETYRDLKRWVGEASAYYGKKVYMAEIARAALRRALRSVGIDPPDEHKSPPKKKRQVRVEKIGNAPNAESSPSPMLGKGAQSFLAMMEKEPKLETGKGEAITADGSPAFEPDPDRVFAAAGPKEDVFEDGEEGEAAKLRERVPQYSARGVEQRKVCADKIIALWAIARGNLEDIGVILDSGQTTVASMMIERGIKLMKNEDSQALLGLLAIMVKGHDEP